MKSTFDIFEHLPEIGEIMKKWRALYARDEDEQPLEFVAPKDAEMGKLFEAMDEFS